MAGIFLYGPYVITEPGGALAPGEEKTWWWGPWEWEQRAIAVSATPVTHYGGDWAVTVTRVTQEVKADGSRYLYARVKNVGSNSVDFGFYIGGVWKALGE